MYLKEEIEALRDHAVSRRDTELRRACDKVLERLPGTRKALHREGSVFKKTRRNPPLSEHMEEESYDSIFHALVRRIMRSPENSLAFAYDVINAAKEGLLRYRPGSLEKSEEDALSKIEEHLENSLEHLQEALYIMEE